MRADRSRVQVFRLPMRAQELLTKVTLGPYIQAFSKADLQIPVLRYKAMETCLRRCLGKKEVLFLLFQTRGLQIISGV